MNPAKPRPKVDRSATSYHTAQYSVSNYDEEDDLEPVENRYPTPESSRSSPVKPSPTRSHRENGAGSVRNSPTKALRKSQAQALENNSSYFTWRNTMESTTSRLKSVNMMGGLISPASSNAGALAALNGETKPRTTALSRGYSSDSENDDIFSESASPAIGTPAERSRHVEELMEELRDVSAELASSIRREMDLEDELEHYRNEPAVQDPSRRTSDYFSESGTSSMKLPTADTRSKIESLETMRRKVEQEKAKLRLTMAEKAEHDLIQRRALEMHVQSLEEQLQGQSHQDEALARGHDLEAALEDVRQLLSDEHQLRTKAEQLLLQLQTQHEACTNERDNLKEETIPRLRARIEGLESEAADMQKLQYENTQLQQELQMMRSENQTLIEARRLQLDQNQRFKSIVEEDDFAPMSPLASPRPGNGMSRSQSVARTRSVKLNRTNSALNSPNPDRAQQWTTESFKDVEDQRDALHMTLRTLLLRQDVLNREHAKQLRLLQAERDEALRGLPLSSSISQEVQRMRSEFLQLRQRANEASELKWQCEKGLSGLRMDLERTELETDGVQQHAAAVTRSKDVQAEAARKIAEIEVYLRSAEEDVITVQSNFEDALAKEEDHVRTMKEAELVKRTRRVARMAKKGDKQASPLARPTKALKERLNRDDGDGGKMETAKMSGAVRKLEDVVQKAEGEVQELMARLNEVHVEMSGLSA